MKKLLIAAVAVLSLGMWACSGKTTDETTTDNAAEESVLTVDELIKNAAQYDGDTVVVKGQCSHLCAHGGTKAFLANPDTTSSESMLLCMATEEIGGAFSPDCAGKELTVSGIVTPNKATASEMEAYASRMEAAAAEGHCDTESKAFRSMTEAREALKKQMEADEADSTIVLGYYLTAISYTVPEGTDSIQ